MRRRLFLPMVGFLLAHTMPARASPVDPGAPVEPAESSDPARSVLSLGLGIGIASPDDPDLQALASGGYGDVEYVHRANRWFTPILYGGVLLATPDPEECGVGLSPCDVSARFAFAGAKLRLMAPIPYVGPFLELGLGLSAGRIETRAGDVDLAHRGLMYHVPWAIGLALGRRHNHVVAFKYLQHPEQQQVSGAVALSVGFER